MLELLASPDMGTPSMTYSGSLVPLKEVTPRMRTEVLLPGVPEFCVMVSPDALPCSNWSTLGWGILARSTALTDDIEPLISPRFCVPSRATLLQEGPPVAIFGVSCAEARRFSRAGGRRSVDFAEGEPPMVYGSQHSNFA